MAWMEWLLLLRPFGAFNWEMHRVRNEVVCFCEYCFSHCLHLLGCVQCITLCRCKQLIQWPACIMLACRCWGAMPFYLLPSFNKPLYSLSWEEQIKQIGACSRHVFDVAPTILDSEPCPWARVSCVWPLHLLVEFESFGVFFSFHPFFM